jgi:hypothetical protein
MSVTLQGMSLLISRSVPTLDVDSLEWRETMEALFRDGDRFVLYLSDGGPPPRRSERLISINCRQALLWLNESPAKAGSFWE